MAQSTSSTGNQPLIELKHVDKHYGDLHVLNDINLSVDRGEVVVVIGPSGSGKSTMCRTINRLETIDSGEILIEGEPLPQEGKDLARMRAELGMVFQQFNLFAHMTVLQNVMLGPVDVLGVSKDEARERAMDLLSRVGVAEQADKVPAQLSGGQQQRVAIARSLAMQPKAMLFDEPTSALDPEMINGARGHGPPGPAGHDDDRDYARDELCPPRGRPRRVYGRRPDRRDRHARRVLRPSPDQARPRLPQLHQGPLTQLPRGTHSSAAFAPRRPAPCPPGFESHAHDRNSHFIVIHPARRRRSRRPPAHPGGAALGRGEAVFKRDALPQRGNRKCLCRCHPCRRRPAAADVHHRGH